MCIGKENTLLFELLESGFDTTPLITLSKKLKQIACALMLYKGPESAAAAGALLVCPYQNNCYNALFLLYVIRFFGLFISSFYYADDDALIEGFSEGG